MTDADGYELAMLKTAAGEPVIRTAAQASFARFKAAVAQAGGRAPLGRDGRGMLWNEVRGWHERDESPERRPRTMAEMVARQKLVDHQTRQDRINDELSEDRALIAAARALPLSWNHARSFRAGEPWPGSGATEAERLGWRLKNRGWATPADIPSPWKDFTR